MCMSNIIKFPRKRVTHMRNDHTVERIDADVDSQGHKLDFTCVTCQNITSFQLHNAVFKNLEIFCGKCGSGWRVSNPIFTRKTIRNS